MATENFYYTENKTVRVTKLCIQEGHVFVAGQVLFHYDLINDNGAREETAIPPNKQSSHSHVVRANNSSGLVESIKIKEGDEISNGCVVFEYSSCSHRTVMKDMCAECGADLRESDQRNQTAAVAMVHNIPELMVSMKEAQLLGMEDEKRLLKDRKLVLLVDLDQTLIHTTNDQIPENIKDVFHFQLPGSNSSWYHTRLRPYTKEFLQEISQLYELHICTFGSRTYAHTIARFLDESGHYFSHRILSRDECFSSHSKTANLKALFPCGDHMVVIIDDREDVWNYAPNLIHVRPYHFFQHTGDINAPPGLAKQEKDDKEGFDFTGYGEKESESLNEKTTKNPNSNGSATEGKKSEILDVNESSADGDSTNSTDLNKIASKNENLSPSDSLKGNSESSNDVPNIEMSKNDDDIAKSECGSKEMVEKTIALDTSPDVEGLNPSIEDNQEMEVEVKEVCSKEGNKKNIEPEQTVVVEDQREKKIDIEDADDYLLHLQDILRTIHKAYYEMFEDNCKQETKIVPDMKKVLPYVRRKVLEKECVVFSGVVPTNVALEKSKPYLVARSLGAVVMDRVTEKTTHVIAARPGTNKLYEAKKFKHIKVVTPDWLWSCAERWEHVEELLYPLSSDGAQVRRKPPPHCTSPDLALQLALAASAKDEKDYNTPVYDRVTGKRIFRQVKKSDKGKSLANNSRIAADLTTIKPETNNPWISMNKDEIGEMYHDVDDCLTDEEEEEGFENQLDDDNEENLSGSYSAGASSDTVAHGTSRKRKLEPSEHDLVIGDVSEVNDQENDSLMTQFRRGETIPVVEGDEPDEEDSNEAEMDQLEPEAETDDDFELCLAGQALEREFLSADEGDY